MKYKILQLNIHFCDSQKYSTISYGNYLTLLKFAVCYLSLLSWIIWVTAVNPFTQNSKPIVWEVAGTWQHLMSFWSCFGIFWKLFAQFFGACFSKLLYLPIGQVWQWIWCYVLCYNMVEVFKLHWTINKWDYRSTWQQKIFCDHFRVSISREITWLVFLKAIDIHLYWLAPNCTFVSYFPHIW